MYLVPCYLISNDSQAVMSCEEQAAVLMTSAGTDSTVLITSLTIYHDTTLIKVEGNVWYAPPLKLPATSVANICNSLS